MKFLYAITSAIKAMLLNSYTRLDLAEILMYDWDGVETEDRVGVFPRTRWKGWTTLIGRPFSILFEDGPGFVPGGWVDVHHLGQVAITAKLTGAVGVAGSVILIFQGAMDLVTLLQADTPDDMQFTADVNGADEVQTRGIIDVGHWNFMRFYGVNNLAGGSVSVAVTTHDGVYPVQLPA